MITVPKTMIIIVHVAGEPGDDHLQRCVVCGAVLLDNRPWHEGRAMVPAGAPDGPCWWPPSAMVATNKPHDGTGGGVTWVVDPGQLSANDPTCQPR